MIFGVDTARFQPIGTYDPGAFEVVNIEDPQFEAKTARNLADGRPTGFYVWIYPGTDVRAFTTWAIGKARAAGSNFGAWADYEQDGVTVDLLDQFFASCDAAGERAGYYGNDWRFGHANYLARPYWYCGYPDPNDGQWRDGYSPSASRSVQLFQFTSGGGLDRNVVTDEGWFAAWTGSTPAPAPHPELAAIEGDEMRLVRATSDGYWCKAGQWWVIGPGSAAFQVGQGQTYLEVAADWGWLGQLGSLPGEWVDKYISAGITDYVRGTKVDAFLKAQAPA